MVRPAAVKLNKATNDDTVNSTHIRGALRENGSRITR